MIPQQSSKIRVPEGLLQNVSNDIYTFGSRHDQDGRENQPLDRSLQQPAQAVLATQGPHRRYTADFGPHGRNQLGRVRNSSLAPEQQLLRRSSTYRRPGLPQEQWPSGRANSINIATLFRARPRQESTVQFVTFAEANSIWDTAEQQFLTKVVSRTVSPLQVLSEHKEADGGPPRSSGASSPYLKRISIHEIPSDGTHRQSYISGPDTIAVRRPTGQSVASRASIFRRLSGAVGNAFGGVASRPRQGSVWQTYERAKQRQKQLQRSKPFQIFFQYTIYLILLAFVYLVLVGRPLWGGTVWYIYVLFEYHLAFVGGSAIFIGLAFFYAIGPLLVLFERPAPMPMPMPSLDRCPDDEKPHFPPAPFIRCLDEASKTPSDPSTNDDKEMQDTKLKAGHDTALLIPCYKSAGLLPATLEAALKIFPATSIFILANGNSPTPLDNTEDVCNQYGVHHIWTPIGSKIIAQFVGAYVARSFPYALLIDDDCLLPPNFPIVTDRLKGKVKVLGYTITSIGSGRSRGTYCQQAQDLEYKLSGLQRLFAGRIGSATFPHGAIVLWEMEFLIRTFKEHPGFSVSEDWFFGHVARVLGSRTIMCSSVFVETETPASLFFASGGARGGFGEMTVFKQRFKRWNFFFVNGCYYNLVYILFSWRLGFWEFGAKLFVFQEVYETFLYLITPLVLPISFIVRPAYTAYLFAATLGMYFLTTVVFNEVHLRLASRGAQKNMMVNRWMLVFYYMPYKIALTVVNVASCWWSLWKYAKYFAKRHPRLVEDEKAVGLILKIEEGKEETARSTLEKQEGARTRGLRTSRVGSGPGRGMVRMHTKSSTRSQGSSADSIGPDEIRPRRLTVTAVKMDVRQEDIAGQDEPDKSTSLTGGVMNQLHSWTPSWLGRSDSGGRNTMRRESPTMRRESPMLAQVIEAEDEDEEELGGYSYYGV